MELEHRVGQLLFIGLPGLHVDTSTRDLLETIQPGGVVLGPNNVESGQQVVELLSTVRSIIKVSPIVAIDQEGGRMDRLKPVFSAMPSAELIKTARDAAAAAKFGEITAEALRTLGFNANFAPVLDIGFRDDADNGLNGRYLGSTAAEVVRLSGAYLEGLQRGGIVGVGKHFPGIGGATDDPNLRIAQIDRTRDDLLRHDLLPYTELFTKINARLNTVLISNAHYPAFDGPSPLPAALSRNVVTGLLREELGFKGLAITGDLNVPAVTSIRDLKDAAIMAVEAGVDMVALCAEPERTVRVWEAMIEAGRNGGITPKRISRSFDNIARVKSMLSPPHPLTEMSISRLRERIGELNLMLQHPR